MKIKSVLVGMALLGVVAARGATTNDLAGALRNGLFEEQVDHNLDAAIATYQSVVTKFDTDRQLTATAAFRLGECYRAEGKTNEAIVQYQRVLTDFSDQATLVKLSQQNLAELSAGRSVMPPLPAQPALAQAILDRSKSQQSQDELAKLRTAYAGKVEISTRLHNLGLQELRQQLPTITSDALLIKYLEELSVAEQEFLKVKNNARPENPVYQEAQELVTNNDQRVNERIAGLLASMKTELAGIKAQMDQLEKDSGAMSPEEQAIQIQTQRAAMMGQYTNFVVPPTTDEEGQEIVRIQAMIQNSPDLINAVGGEDSTTPLIRAARNDQLQVAKFLLEHGADVNATGPFQETALHAAAGTGHRGMVELLLAHSADVNAKKAASPGSMEGTPLDLAVDKNYPAVVEVLLAHNADPNIAGEDALTPLHRAALKGSVSLAKLLVTHGADVNATNANNRTSLHLAAGKGNADIVSFLLEKKAEVNTRDNEGKTPLFWGIKYPAVVKMLLANGAAVNVQDNNGKTPLAVAAMEGHTLVETVKILLDAGADANISTTGGNQQNWAPLHYAAQRGNADVAEALLSHRANPDAVTKEFLNDNNQWTEGTTPLILAVANKRADVVALLLHHKANPNLMNLAGDPPLQWAIHSQDTNTIDELLRAGADVNKPFKDGFTPLQWVVNSRWKNAVEMILAYHPDVNAISPQGFTALDLIRGQNNPLDQDIAALLRAHGALDKVAKFDRIQVSRPSTKYLADVFWKGTNDWNHFSLLEVVLNGVSDGGPSPVSYGFLSPSRRVLLPGPGLPPQGPADARIQRIISNANGLDKLDFPDLAHLVVVRHIRGKTNEVRIPVNILNATNGIDCSKDMTLEFGDVVEIPELEHALAAQSGGLSYNQKDDIVNCLKGTVRFVVHGQTTDTAVYPYTSSKLAEMLYDNTEVQRTLLSSSDLSRVKVTRTDRRTGKKLEWTVDCSNPQFPPDLWLRDGDVVEVPEK